MGRAARWTAVAFSLAGGWTALAQQLWPRVNPGPLALLAAGLVLLAASGLSAGRLEPTTRKERRPARPTVARLD